MAAHDEQRLVLGGARVRVRFGGDHLRRRFGPALEHLVDDDIFGEGREDLLLCCWDGTASKLSLPPPPWRGVDFLGDSRIRGHISGPLIATYDADAQLFQLLDRPGRRAILHVADESQLPAWHDRAPFRSLLSRWADTSGLALMHGSSVAVDGAAVVVAGRSGAGKSTTAMACLAAGMDFLGDDACLVNASTGLVWSMYGLAKVEADAARRLGDLSHVGPLGGTQAGSTVLAPRRVVRSAQLRAVVLSSISHQSGSVLSGPLALEDALEELIGTVWHENGGLTPDAAAALRDVAAAIPVLRLHCGANRQALVSTVRGLLS